MSSASATITSASLDCKVIAGLEMLGPKFEKEFCDKLIEYLLKSGELALKKSVNGGKLSVKLAILQPNLADISIKWEKVPELKLSLGSRDAGLKPSSAQTLVLPILQLVQTGKKIE